MSDINERCPLCGCEGMYMFVGVERGHIGCTNKPCFLYEKAVPEKEWRYQVGKDDDFVIPDGVPAPFDPERLTEELYQYMHKKGISRFVFVIGDPDHPTLGQGWGGGTIWGIGACHVMEADLTKEQLGEPTIAERDDDGED